MLKQSNGRLELGYQIEAAGSAVTIVTVFSFAPRHRTSDNSDLKLRGSGVHCVHLREGRKGNLRNLRALSTWFLSAP